MNRPKKTKITTMRLAPDVMKAALKHATKVGLSRSKYIEQLIRKDLKMEGVDLDERASVFG